MGAMYRRRAKRSLSLSPVTGNPGPTGAISGLRIRGYRRSRTRDPYAREYQTPQRIDPGHVWGNRRYY